MDVILPDEDIADVGIGVRAGLAQVYPGGHIKQLSMIVAPSFG